MPWPGTVATRAVLDAIANLPAPVKPTTPRRITGVRRHCRPCLVSWDQGYDGDACWSCGAPGKPGNVT